jgi:hypothetical protein
VRLVDGNKFQISEGEVKCCIYIDMKSPIEKNALRALFLKESALRAKNFWMCS